MSDPITDAVAETLAGATPKDAQPPPPPAPIPGHVAANIMEFLKRVETKGLEAFALVEAYTHLQRFAAPPPTGPGVPFTGTKPA
jgi:hypothetical protein